MWYVTTHTKNHCFNKEKDHMARPPKRDYLLRVISTSKGLTGEFVSSKIGVPINNLWRAEVGKIVSENIVLKIAKALRVDSDIMFYNMGRFPPDKREFVIKDPLFFKDLVNNACKEPWKLTKTKEYMETIKSKMEEIKTKEQGNINPEIKNILSSVEDLS